MCKAMGKLFLFGVIGFAISWAALYYRYSDEKITLARKYRLDPPPGLVGNLFINADLEKAKHILDGKIFGPESMVVDDEAIYVSVYDAKILKIVNGQVVSKAAYSEKSKFFPDCGHFDTEPECGRPLGIRRLVEGKPKFVVADAYLGVYIVDFTDEQDPKSTQILDSRVPIEGYKPRFLNDLDVISDDELVITDSSVRHDRRHFMPLILEHQADGRILHLKISTKTVKVLADKLYFPNGIQLTEDKKSVLFSECSMARIKKLTIASGKIEMFAFNLPGLPDNIRRSGRGTYWVGLAATRSATHPSTSVIITEDDLDIAPDLFSYFLNLRYLLEKDKTLWCVSAWNDNGKPGNIDRIANTKLYRSDFFPGLEWMMTRRTWQELEPKWPGGFWDDWMREPEQRKGRQCIRPEISRTGMTKDGRKGVSGGRFFRNHLSKMLYQLHIGNLFSVSSNTHILLS